MVWVLIRRLASAPEKPPALGVTIWRLNIARQYARLAALARSLSEDERQRAEQFVFDHDRASFIVVRGVLRAILGGYLGIPPERVRFAYGSQQKPSLAPGISGEPGADTLEFNISHSGQRALIAITYGRAVGVDLEQLRRLPDLEQLMRYCCTPHEQNILAALAPGARHRAFFSFWTAKEAYIKARGVGMTLPLQSIELRIHAARAVGFRALTEDDADDADDAGEGREPLRWVLSPVNAGRGYSGAVVTLGPVTTLNYHDWE